MNFMSRDKLTRIWGGRRGTQLQKALY